MSEFLNENDIIEVMTERMSFGLPAVARFLIEGTEKPVVVFVAGAAPNERVRVKITKKQKNYFNAEVVEVLEPSPDRITPKCEYFGFGPGKCGGCDWQHLSYAAQLREKKDVLLQQITRATYIAKPELEKITQVHGAVNPFEYRRRIQIRGDIDGIGFYERGTKNIVHIDHCAITHPRLQKKWMDFLENKSLADLSKKKGFFKLEWTLVTDEKSKSSHIVEAINESHAAHGFTQVNEEQNQVMLKLVNEFVSKSSGKETLLDLYGGHGNLSAQFWNSFKKILCVDEFNSGERPNKISTPLKNGVTLVKGDVERFLSEKQSARLFGSEKIDAVIADPPREGLSGTAELISNLNTEMLVLVSCDPSTLARDLSTLIKSFSIEAIHLVDMFPQTHHIETIVSLKKIKSKT